MKKLSKYIKLTFFIFLLSLGAVPHTRHVAASDSTVKDPLLDPLQWEISTHGGAQVTRDPGLTIISNSKFNWSGAEAYTTWQFTGDFDIQVDYKAGIGWDNSMSSYTGNPHLDVAGLGIAVDGSTWSVNRFINTERGSNVHYIRMDSVPAGQAWRGLNFMRTSRESSGKFRIIRSGSDVEFQYYRDSYWFDFYSISDITKPVSILMSVTSVATNQTFSTIFENFQINSPSSNVNQVDVTTDYNSTSGFFDKTKILNLSQGGFLEMGDVKWFPTFYDNLEAAGVSMVRLDTLTDDWTYHVISRDQWGRLQFNFKWLDMVILPMLEHGIKPFMCLSYTPGAVGPDSSAPPSDPTEWKTIAFTYVDHYRILGYTGLYWEIWNEPDAPQFWSGTPEQYFKMYRNAAEGVKEADPTAKVGGPASCNLWDPSILLTKFFTFIHDNPGIPVDFVSYHEYAQQNLDSTQTVRKLLAEAHVEVRELLITEWGQDVDVDGDGTAKDTNVGASYVAKIMAYTMNSTDLTKIFHFSASNPGYFGGNHGILTGNNRRKASYNVYVMANKMQPTSLVVTKTLPSIVSQDAQDIGMMATKNDETGRVTIMAWNDSDFNSTISLKVKNLPKAIYSDKLIVTKSLIDATHGNYYADPDKESTNDAPSTYENLASITGYTSIVNQTYIDNLLMTPHSVTQVTLEVPENAWLKVKIVDDESRLVPLATITSTTMPVGQNKVSGITDAMGEYAANNILPGSYTFKIEREGYRPITESITVAEDKLQIVTATLERILFWGLKIRLVDPKIVPGAVIKSTSTPPGQVSLLGVTDDNGEYLFSNVLAGDYVFEIRKEGYKTMTLEQPIPRDQVKSLDVTLERVFDFTIGTTPSSLNIKSGESADITILIAPLAGSGSVSLSATSSARISASFTPASGSPSFKSVATISVASDVKAGTYTTTIIAEGDGVSQSSDVTLFVEEKPVGIPGYPVESVIIGMLLVTMILIHRKFVR